MILGHGHRYVVEAVKKAATRGFSFGAPTMGEIELAEMIVQAVPSIEMVRLVNSGTEATMSALRLARAATGRYEGPQVRRRLSRPRRLAARQGGLRRRDIQRAGLRGRARRGREPDADRALQRSRRRARADEHDEGRGDHRRAGGRQHGLRPAAGRIPRRVCATICDEHGALLIFDEVMTGFRVAYGGAQTRYGVRPDITTLGKIIGGGMPIGAYGASREIMELVSPLGPMYQAGTLSGNPVAVAAGRATLVRAAQLVDLRRPRRAQRRVRDRRARRRRQTQRADHHEPRRLDVDHLLHRRPGHRFRHPPIDRTATSSRASSTSCSPRASTCRRRSSRRRSSPPRTRRRTSRR